MKYAHTSVLLTETVEGLAVKPDGVYADGTLGGGGHAAAICEKLNGQGVFLGIDRDAEAIQAAGERLKDYSCRKILVQASFEEITEILTAAEVGPLDGGVLDLGVSSYQLDNPERGFSYMHQGRLDMRMDAGSGVPDAAEVLATYSEAELTDVIRRYGEERWASRIAQFICRERKKAPIETTAQLVEIIKAAIPASARREGPHPAKRTFQALRIEVNDELGALTRAVDRWIDALAPRGRLAVITFHSLEDRIVKDAFAERETPGKKQQHARMPLPAQGPAGDAKRINKKPVTAGEEELGENPRARSAKLRILEKKGP
ncbi:MAG: 16S rRNA (cytosine(1402)-N(4))-methyltransferase RsmH [Clostridiales Family XIII bacterium]|nr:16S rRNA (cytosine(1402)-N(4))-methyltransferase RsmH [Clostridiales Family XIII bacterium]